MGPWAAPSWQAYNSLPWHLCYRDCFKALYVHKFRAMLGKNRLIFPGEKVDWPWGSVFSPSCPSCRWPVLTTAGLPSLGFEGGLSVRLSMGWDRPMCVEAVCLC
jgi:hypothetical protein